METEFFHGMHTLHQNLISSYDFNRTWVVDHNHQPYHWERDGHLVKEPRKGKRYTIAAEIAIPNSPPVICYSVHLEVFCGILDRIIQFSEVLRDAREQRTKTPHQVILGIKSS